VEIALLQLLSNVTMEMKPQVMGEMPHVILKQAGNEQILLELHQVFEHRHVEIALLYLLKNVMMVAQVLVMDVMLPVA